MVMKSVQAPGVLIRSSVNGTLCDVYKLTTSSLQRAAQVVEKWCEGRKQQSEKRYIDCHPYSFQIVILGLRSTNDEGPSGVKQWFETNDLSWIVPAKFYFTSGLFVTSVLASITYWFWFAVRADVAKRLPTNVGTSIRLLTFSRWMAYISCLALSLVATFPTDRVNPLHQLFKMVLFVTSIIHMVCNLIDRWSEFNNRNHIWYFEFVLTVCTVYAFLAFETLVFANRQSVWVINPTSTNTKKQIRNVERLLEYAVFSGILSRLLMMIPDMSRYTVKPYQLIKKKPVDTHHVWKSYVS
ncbi:hypothetical protein CSKR_108808 [Clonorchis sinensis]|uniref:CWH43-like N-terminal domain-containing protein n=1 Tax=Clonorchis sinensis TaxID=79923 RepID=A0A8T1ME30_CLOSI|nr:hypothetical protein CSKR_108808 [Clonorchis sinensis]